MQLSSLRQTTFLLTADYAMMTSVIGGVHDSCVVETSEEFFNEEHDGCVAVDDHVGRLVIGELRIELETKLCKELYGSREEVF